MHAFLIISHNQNDINEEIKKLSDSSNAKVYPYTLEKIEDVRNLNKFTRLSLSEKTLIRIDNIDKATNEALNAFLKNLEEPQENLLFVLTSRNIRNVLPTIVSRCQIINTKRGTFEIKDREKIEKFVTLNESQRLAFFNKIKDRKEAKDFIENLIFFLHDKGQLKDMDILLKTLTRLNANGNVNLQLTNLAINYGR